MRRDAGADLPGCVGHRAHDVAGAGEDAREGREAFAGEDREHEFAGGEIGEAGIEAGELLRRKLG